MSLKARLRFPFIHRPEDDKAAPAANPAPTKDAEKSAHSANASAPPEKPKESAPPPPPAAENYVTAHEIKQKKAIYEKLISMLDLSKVGELEEKEARAQIQTLSQKLLDEHDVPLSGESRKKVAQLIEDDILGLGPLELLMRDKSITDILINGPKNIFVEKRGKLQKTPVTFDDNAHLMRVVDRIVSRVGRRVDESSPMCDARLADGSRVNVIIPPLALDGATVSIRRFPSDPLRLPALVEKKALSKGMCEFLMAAVAAGKNIVISGGTGSGKTTMLNALSGYIPDSERIVTIEDAAELQLQQSHVVRLETRPPNIEGKGDITQRDLVRNALRMRPDRIVLGEVRGAEAMDMLQAMNTGHDGSLATLHANTPREALGRIENMVAMAGFELPIKAVRAQISAAVDIVVQVQRLEDGSRRMTSICELTGMEGEIITMVELFAFERRGVREDGKITGAFKPSGGVPSCMEEFHRRGLHVNLDLFDPENELEV